jgi:hypothetical protein
LFDLISIQVKGLCKQGELKVCMQTRSNMVWVWKYRRTI